MRNYLKKRELAYAEGKIVGLTTAISIFERYLIDHKYDYETESILRACLGEMFETRTRTIKALKKDKNEN